MTAPDRIWVTPDSDERVGVESDPDWPVPYNYVEYIRKGAFPVEEIQELVNYPERMIDYGSWTTSMQACLERILSLLEGEQG